jgi:hypothetical protein
VGLALLFLIDRRLEASEYFSSSQLRSSTRLTESARCRKITPAQTARVEAFALLRDGDAEALLDEVLDKEKPSGQKLSAGAFKTLERKALRQKRLPENLTRSTSMGHHSMSRHRVLVMARQDASHFDEVAF